MIRYFIAITSLFTILLTGCNRTKEAAAAAPNTPTKISVTTAKATMRTVSASVAATGSFIGNKQAKVRNASSTVVDRTVVSDAGGGGHARGAVDTER